MRMTAAMPGLAALLLSACTSGGSKAEAPFPDRSAADGGASADYRVRSGRATPLNADRDWAAAQGTPAVVMADTPFRLRMELAPHTGLRSQCLRLQYRRNGGGWVNAEAHDFPYPQRELALAFTASDDGRGARGWQVAGGTGDRLHVVADGDGAMLRTVAGAAPLAALYRPPWPLAGAFSLAAELRVAAAGSRSGGLVFGYTDMDNHWRVLLDAARSELRLERTRAGAVQVLAAHSTELRPGSWYELEVEVEEGILAFILDDGAESWQLPAAEGLRGDEVGLYAGAGSGMDVRYLEITGQPRSPRLSIVATDAYTDGVATADLLAGSVAPFTPGTGVNLADCAPVDLARGRHTELEWPLVIRRFADGAMTNAHGDVFDIRAVDSDGRPLEGAPTAQLEFAVPPGHLGGTFVETPGRIGPWRTRDGALYFIMEPAESDNLFMVVKSADGGRSWREVDAVHRPATGDLESVDARLVDGTLHIIHQVTEAVYYHALRTADHPRAPDTWAVTDELVTAISARSQMATLAVRSDGSLVVVYLGDRLAYSVRTVDGNWGATMYFDDGGMVTAGPQAVLGANDMVHLAYYREDGTLWYRRLAADGTVGAPQRLASGAGTGEAHYGAVLPLVYLPQSDTVVIAYRLADGRLWERRIHGTAAPAPARLITGRPVVRDAVDSQQAGADAVAWGEHAVVGFIDAENRSIYTTVHRGEGWETPTLAVQGILGSWVRGDVYRRADGATVYGFVYDAGSFGGAGMNRYSERVLRAP